MASRSARQRFNRRDRRKAKASDWRREPKKPGRIGHGTAATVGRVLDSAAQAPTKPEKRRKRPVRSKASIDQAVVDELAQTYPDLIEALLGSDWPGD